VVQEALTNVYRHSGSKVAEVELARNGHKVHVKVRDYGTATPPSGTPFGSQGKPLRLRASPSRLRASRASPSIRCAPLRASRKARLEN